MIIICFEKGWRAFRDDICFFGIFVDFQHLDLFSNLEVRAVYENVDSHPIPVRRYGMSPWSKPAFFLLLYFELDWQLITSRSWLIPIRNNC